MYRFDEPLDRAQLSTAKWESEIARTDDPTLLCFGTADMDFRSAPAIVEAIRDVASRGHFGYPHKPRSYHDAVLGYFARRWGWIVAPESLDSHVGIYPSIQVLLEIFSEPGDEVVFQTPVHHIFEDLIHANGRVPLANELAVRDGVYEMDMASLTALVTPRTKVFLLCNPHNPVGRAWTPAELSILNDFCVERGIKVISDEVYGGLTLPGHRFTPMATVSSSAADNTATVASASKAFNLTGLKHSLVVISHQDDMAAYRLALHRTNLFFGGSIFGIAATEVALRDCDDWSDSLMDYVASNLALLRDFLRRDLPGVILIEPEATYFAWLDVSALGMDDESIARFLESEAHVVVSYGSGMGPGGSQHVRVNLACPQGLLRAGLERLTRATADRAGCSNDDTMTSSGPHT